ncbi:MAG: hypothetical protein RIR43_1649, partial [Pseudomonadota bacterium]
RLKEITGELGIPFIFKSSYDKANRSSGSSFRGPGMDRGLEILSEVRRQLGVPILTDVHTEEEVPRVASVVDVLQTPAFLCRQTDFIRAVAQCGKPVNIKKGQFLAPHDMKNVIDKARAAARAFSMTFFMSWGARNWPFLMFTGLPLCATVRMKSVCRHRKAGVCSTSTTAATSGTSSSVCTSVRIGTPS